MSADQNREEVVAMFAEHRERIVRAWTSALPVGKDMVTLQFVFDVDGFVTGAGATVKEARESALLSEIVSMSGDDSRRHAANIDAFVAEVERRAGRHYLAQVEMARSAAEALCKLDALVKSPSSTFGTR